MPVLLSDTTKDGLADSKGAKVNRPVVGLKKSESIGEDKALAHHQIPEEASKHGMPPTLKYSLCQSWRNRERLRMGEIRRATICLMSHAHHAVRRIVDLIGQQEESGRK